MNENDLKLLLDEGLTAALEEGKREGYGTALTQLIKYRDNIKENRIELGPANSEKLDVAIAALNVFINKMEEKWKTM